MSCSSYIWFSLRYTQPRGGWVFLNFRCNQSNIQNLYTVMSTWLRAVGCLWLTTIQRSVSAHCVDFFLSPTFSVLLTSINWWLDQISTYFVQRLNNHGEIVLYSLINLNLIYWYVILLLKIDKTYLLMIKFLDILFFKWYNFFI